MITYFLKSATCLALLLAFYHFVLEKEKMHNFNRFYLLGSVLFSFVAPLYVIYIDVAPVVLETIQTTSEINLTDFTPIEIIEEKIINYTQIFIGIYILVSAILLIRFGKNIFNILNKIRRNKTIKYQNARLVLVNDNILPHTFWNYIFINRSEYENQKIEQELFTHELTHVTQKHTLDVLILEVIQIIFWINPFFILLKKAVQLNHEFLADEKVINQHKNTFQYQYLLLSKAAWKNEYYLASNLNYSLTKKRLLMMTTQSSRTKILLKKLAVIPLLASFIFLFAERVEAQEKVKEDLETIYEQEPKKDNELREIINEISAKYHNSSYKELNKFYESKRNQKPHFVKSSKERQRQLKERFSELGSLYFKLSKDDKKKTKRPILPHHPYLRLMKNNKVFYKLRKELTEEDKLLLPPPPPVPNASKEEILRAKKAYKAWKKRTDNKIPLPPKKVKQLKIKVKEIGKKNKKPVLIEVIEKQKVAKLIEAIKTPLTKEVEEIKEEIEVIEVIKVLKTPKVVEVIEEQEVVTIDKLNELTNEEVIDLKLNYDKKNITYYLDNKKITKKHLFKIEPNDIKSVSVKKDKGDKKRVYITTKK